MDAWPLGAAGREQHWSCQTGWGGCIRSSSPSSGVNRRRGTFTQPLTSGVTSEVTIKVRGQQGPLWSVSSQAPPADRSPTFSVLSTLSLSLYFYLFVHDSHSLFLGRYQLRHPLPWDCRKGKQEKINREDEWRLGGPIKKAECFNLSWYDLHKHIPIHGVSPDDKQEGGRQHERGKGWFKPPEHVEVFLTSNTTKRCNSKWKSLMTK